jgi:hypothetical protein
VKNGPAASNSFSRMPGSWFGIVGSHRIRGWQEHILSYEQEFTRDRKLELT